LIVIATLGGIKAHRYMETNANFGKIVLELPA